MALLFVQLAGWAVWGHLGYGPTLFLLGLLAATRVDNWRVGLLVFGRGVRWRSPSFVAGAAAIAFCAWVALTGAWSPQGKGILGLHVFVMALTGAGATIEALRRRGRTLRLLTVSYLVYAGLAVALLLVEALTGGALRAAAPPRDITPERFDDITDLGRGMTALIPSLFAAGALAAVLLSAGAWRRRAALAACLVLAFVAALLAASKLTIAANSAALLVGAIAAAAAYAAPRAALKALAALIVLGLVALPLAAALLPAADLAAASPHAPPSWLQRLFIWRQAGDAIVGCQPFGCGVDYARELSTADAMVAPPAGAPLLPLRPRHPHNAFLQIWLELGLVGAALAGAVICSSAALLLQADLSRPVAAGTAGVAAATLVSFLVEASLWQDWRLAAIGIAAAGLALAHAATRERLP